jgi:hypothetical protein
VVHRVEGRAVDVGVFAATALVLLVRGLGDGRTDILPLSLGILHIN